MGLGERWTVLCNWVEHRANLLELVQGDITKFHHIKQKLSAWMGDTEKTLKNMEQESSSHSDPNLDLSLNTPLLISQINELKVRINVKFTFYSKNYSDASLIISSNYYKYRVFKIITTILNYS